MYLKDFGFLGLSKINYWHFLCQDRISKVAECIVDAQRLLDLGEIWEQGFLRLLQSSWSHSGTGFWRSSGGEQRCLGRLGVLCELPWGNRDIVSRWDLGRGTGSTPCLPRGRGTGLASAGALLVQEKAAAARAPGLALLISSSFGLNAVTSLCFGAAMRKSTKNSRPVT